MRRSRPTESRRESSRSSNWKRGQVSAREELRGLINVLSDEESEHLVSLVRDAVAGERFWETDVAIVYNEYVKGRYRQLGPPPASGDGMAPGASLGADDGMVAVGTLREPPSGTAMR